MVNSWMTSPVDKARTSSRMTEEEEEEKCSLASTPRQRWMRRRAQPTPNRRWCGMVVSLVSKQISFQS